MENSTNIIGEVIQIKGKFRLASNGKVSCIELCGKSIGKSVDHILFEHDTNTNTKRLELGINLDSFKFLEDGYFDKFEKMLDEEEPSTEE